MSEQNKAVVRRLFEDHWNRKNRSLADELYAPSAILHTPDGVLRACRALPISSTRMRQRSRIFI